MLFEIDAHFFLNSEFKLNRRQAFVFHLSAHFISQRRAAVCRRTADRQNDFAIHGRKSCGLEHEPGVFSVVAPCRIRVHALRHQVARYKTPLSGSFAGRLSSAALSAGRPAGRLVRSVQPKPSDIGAGGFVDLDRLAILRALRRSTAAAKVVLSKRSAVLARSLFFVRGEQLRKSRRPSCLSDSHRAESDLGIAESFLVLRLRSFIGFDFSLRDVSSMALGGG